MKSGILTEPELEEFSFMCRGKKTNIELCRSQKLEHSQVSQVSYEDPKLPECAQTIGTKILDWAKEEKGLSKFSFDTYLIDEGKPMTSWLWLTC